MIITVTLNPAADKTLGINNFSIDNVNRVCTSRLDAGGKGINVSKVINKLGGESRAVGILAGNTGHFIKDYMESVNIENEFLFIKGETRTNIKVVDEVNHTNTDINEYGPQVSSDDLDTLLSCILEKADENLILVLSGSIPKNADKKIYKIWTEKAKKMGAKVILDADGELLKYGIEAGPYIIKPNIHELEEYFNKKINGINEIIEYSRILLDYVNFVIVSLGENGSLFIKKGKAVWAKGINVEVKSTVGAGDSMVAALAFAEDKKLDFEETVRLAAASGTASVMTSGTQAADLNIINELKKKIELEYLSF